jgi:SAM-dependent methyltransferase
LVRPATRDKYFPANPFRQLIINRFLAAVAEQLAGLEWQSLLDVGCGEGFVDYYLGRRFPGRAIVQLEPDPAALEAALRINPAALGLRGDGRRLPFPDQSFDAVVCTEVVEHLPYYPEVLHEIARVARRGAVISAPCWPWYQAFHLLAGRHWTRWGEHPDHVVKFSSSFFLDTLRKNIPGRVRVRLSQPWLIARGQKGEEGEGR